MKISRFYSGLFALLTLTATPVAAGPNSDLEAELKQKKAALTDLTTNINNASQADFSEIKDLDLKLNMSIIKSWLTEISTPNLTVHGVAIYVSDAIVYQGGWYKVDISPLDNTWATVSFSPFQASGSDNAILISTKLVANAKSRLTASVGQQHPNVLCKMKPVSSPVKIRLDLSQPTPGPAGNSAPYSLTLLQPTSLDGKAICGLGSLPPLTMNFPIFNVASALSQGSFDLGYTGQFKIPPVISGGAQTIVGVSLNGAEARIDPDWVSYRANLSVP